MAENMYRDYAPSGAYKNSGLWGIPLGTALLSSSAAVLYTWFTYNHLPDQLVSGYLILFLFAAWAFLTCAAAAAMTRLFKMRNPGLAITMACLGAAAGWLCSWLALKNISAQPLSFFTFLAERFNDGVRFGLPAKNSRYIAVEHVRGLLLAAGWLMELFIIVCFAAIGSKSQAEQPFSETDGDWLPERQLKLKAVLPEYYKHMIKDMAEGNLKWLHILEASETPRRLSWRKLAPFLTLNLMGYSGAELSCLSITVHFRSNWQWHRANVVKKLKLTTEESAFIISKFDSGADK